MFRQDGGQHETERFSATGRQDDKQSMRMVFVAVAKNRGDDSLLVGSEPKNAKPLPGKRVDVLDIHTL